MSDARLGTRLFALDLRSVAAFRIALGATLLLDLATRAVSLGAHYTDFGVLPRPDLFRVTGAAFWSLHAATGSVAGEAVLFVLAALCAVSLLVGYRTRLSAVVSLVLLLSLQNRNLGLFYGFDLMLRAWLLWGCFLPLGSRFSVDDALRAVLKDGAQPRADMHLGPGSFALTVQVVLVYLSSGLQKIQDPSWQDLSAVFHALTIDNHATSWARPLAMSGWDRELSVAVLAVELLAPLLLFVPLFHTRVRLAAIGIFWSFHIATALLFTLGLFPLIGIVAWIPFVPGAVWDAFSAGRPAWVRRAGVDVDGRPLQALLVGALLTLILGFNAETVLGRPLLSAQARSAGLILHLDQTWNMFVRPMRDGWYVARGTFADGREVDVLRRGEAVSFDKPALVSSTFRDMRWRKYITNLSRNVGARYRVPFVRSLCRRWNAAATEDAGRVASIELVFVAEEETRDGPASVERITLAKLNCPTRAKRPKPGAPSVAPPAP